MRNVKEWWTEAIHKQGPSKKVMASLVMLISWEIWKVNARIFQNSSSTANMVFEKIKEEIALWSLAGAKAVSNVMPREYALCFGLDWCQVYACKTSLKLLLIK
jgi:hypothetical protein